MKRNFLGNTGIEVSEICFGTLTLGPLQKNMSINEALPILNYAHNLGINFFDTADMYNTYDYLRELLKKNSDIVICSRSYDYSEEGLNKSLERALRELNRDYIDLFLLHEQESRYTFEGHADAFNALLKAKQAGKVRAIGFSTHRIEAVRDALDYNDLEVIFPLINKNGLGIEDGSAQEMLKAIEKAKKAGKAVFGMKPLGGGNLIKERENCFNFVRNMLDRSLLDSVAIGMQSISEVEYNTRFLSGENISQALIKSTKNISRTLHIDDWCEGCGKCQKKCHQNALKLIDNKMTVDKSKCLTCGYCASVCPVFAIKVV